MEKVVISKYWYLLLDSDSNEIKDKGCQYVFQGNWPKLRKVWISISIFTSGENGLTDMGCQLIAKKSTK